MSDGGRSHPPRTAPLGAMAVAARTAEMELVRAPSLDRAATAKMRKSRTLTSTRWP